MNKKLLAAGLAAIGCACLFCGCDKFKSVISGLKPSSDVAPAFYEILYSDGVTTHTLTVQKGQLYTIPQEHIPQKEGYTFLGWFDGEEWGKQYVTELGMGKEAFADNKNIVLYPQFEAYEYKLHLDYGIAGDNEDTYTVASDEAFPQLPVGFPKGELHYYVFQGWYTEENCGGVKVSGANGASDLTFDADFRALADENRALQLYAGYEIGSYSVKFHSKDGALLKETTVPYGTAIADIAPTEYEGKQIVDWTRTNGGSAVTGNVEGTLVLYVRSYGFLFTFDYADGTTETKRVAEGDSVVLPTAERTGYTFEGWLDAVGKIIDEASVAPMANMTLTAKWSANAYVVQLDANGGDLSATEKTVYYGAAYTLPVPQKSGYTFLAWQTEDGESLTGESGSSVTNWNKVTGITLVASWGKNSTVTYDLSLSTLKTTATVTQNTAGIYDGSRQKLAVPTSEYYTFVGWYTSSTFAADTAVTDGQGALIACSGYTQNRAGGYTWIREEDCKLYAKWAQTYDKTYIASASDFKTIATAGNYLLLKSFSLKDAGYVPLGTFQGTLDGNGYTISNWNYTGVTGDFKVGLFGTNKGTIKNLKLSGCTLTTGDLGNASTRTLYIGTVCGVNTGTIENVIVQNGSVYGKLGKIEVSTTFNTYAGTVAGESTGTIKKCGVTNCTIEAQTRTGYEDARSYVGGIVGQATGGNIENCYSRNGKITAYGKGSKMYGIFGIETGGGRPKSYAGGVVGYASSVFMTNVLGYRNTISAKAEEGAKGHNTAYGGSLIGVNGSASMARCYSEASDTLIGSGSSSGASKVTMSLSNLGFSSSVWQDSSAGPVIIYGWK